MTEKAKLFPIGTVVILKESTAALMISGYLAESEQRPNYIWDYSGFLYPIGLQDETEVYTFDHSQIEHILAFGYQDGETFAFMQKIQQIAANLYEAAKKESQRTNENQQGEGEKDV